MGEIVFSSNVRHIHRIMCVMTNPSMSGTYELCTMCELINDGCHTERGKFCKLDTYEKAHVAVAFGHEALHE